MNLNGLYDKRGKRDVDHNGAPFNGSSSYVTTFADYGSLPKANLKEQKKFVAGFGDFGVVRVSRFLDPDVEQLVMPYRKMRNVV